VSTPFFVCLAICSLSVRRHSANSGSVKNFTGTVRVILFKLSSSSNNNLFQFHFNMPKSRKPAANTSKISTASARPKATKENPPPHSSRATRPTSASKPLGTQISSSNGAKDAETAALIAKLRGQSFFKKLIKWLILFQRR
jgi:hypothetical protein